jgi:DNA damage-binding protein 1
MSCNYVVTAYKGSAVTAAQTGNFTAPEDINLIQAKGSSLVVSVVTPEGLKLVADVNIYGRICLMQLFRPKGENQDLLFFMTARYHLAVVSYDASKGDLVTRAYGDVKDRVGRPTEGRQMGVVDPGSNMIALHLYCGMLKVVPLQLDSTEPLTAFNIRLDDLIPLDLVFLKNCEKPSLAYITEDSTGRYLKTAEVSVVDKELLTITKPASVESLASCLHPLPLGGVLVIGNETLACHSSLHHAVDFPLLKECIVSCVGTVDSSRFLLGDANGRLLMLFIETEQRMNSEETTMSMKLEVLGETASPSCMAYLDNGVVFVGSYLGDSQLVKLTTAADENGSYIEVLETFTCLAPILDMSVVDLDKQGREVVVTCSGYGRNGSLRVVRSGVGINEMATIDLAGVKGVWSLHCGPGITETDNTLVIAFVGQTAVLSLKGEEVEETELDGIAADQQTHFCANVAGNKILQITAQSVRLINEETLELVSTWSPASRKNISGGSCAGGHVVVAVGNEIHCLDIQPSELVELSHAAMDHDIACVDVRSLEGSSGTGHFCAIGLWTDISACVLRLPSLDTLHTQPLGGDILPRSILISSFNGHAYLLVALGDGTLHYYKMDADSGGLSHGKKVVLGTKPIVLRQFLFGDTTHVFACSNHPTIVHWSNHKLLFSNVNLKEVNYICTLNADSFKDSLALVDDNTLTIGSLDQLQMLHIHTVPLSESPRRICYQESSHTFLVSTCRVDVPNTDKTALIAPRMCASKSLSTIVQGTHPDDLSIPPIDTSEELEVFSLLLFDENSLEVLSGYQLSPREHIVSVTSCALGSTATPMFAVGTAFVDPTEKEPNRGRTMLFRATHTKALEVAYMKDEAGAVFQVVPFHDKLLVSVNSEVRLYKWEEGELVLECSYSDTILALFIKCHGDFVLIGDLMRSFKLLVYKAEKNAMEEISLDTSLNPVFMTAIEMIDDETYLGADGRHLFICQKNSEAAVESDLQYMLQPSRIYIGDNINTFNRGSLVMEHPGASASPIQGKPIIYGSVHGAVGLIGQLEMSTFSLLAKLQEKMAAAVKSVGNIEHEVYPLLLGIGTLLYRIHVTHTNHTKHKHCSPDCALL